MMRTAEMSLKQYGHGRRADSKGAATVLANWIVRLFGCWHREMSRPLTVEGETYRACLDCGAHRRFDTWRWEMVGDYYYQPVMR